MCKSCVFLNKKFGNYCIRGAFWSFYWKKFTLNKNRHENFLPKLYSQETFPHQNQIITFLIKIIMYFKATYANIHWWAGPLKSFGTKTKCLKTHFVFKKKRRLFIKPWGVPPPQVNAFSSLWVPLPLLLWPLSIERTFNKQPTKPKKLTMLQLYFCLSALFAYVM